MNTVLKRITSTIFISAFLISSASCFSDDSRSILAAAGTYTEGLIDPNIPKVARGSIGTFQDDRSYWEHRLSFSTYSGYNEDEAKIYSAIAKSISCEIDEGSVITEDRGRQGTVTVTFSIADYEELLDLNESMWASDLEESIADLERANIVIDIRFVKENGVWLCSNSGDVLEELFAFTDIEFPVRRHHAGYIDSVCWTAGSFDGHYTNAESICMYLDDYRNGNVGLEDSYFIVTCDGEEIYRQDDCGGIAEVFATDIPGHTDETGHIIAPGEYEITFFDEDDTEIISGTAHVDVEEEELIIQPYLRWWMTSAAVDQYGTPLTIDFGGVTEDPVYINTISIDVNIEYSGIYPYWDGYVTLEYDGEIVCRQDGVEELFITAIEVDDEYRVDGELYFIPGEYTVTFYDADDNPVSRASCMVELELEEP